MVFFGRVRWSVGRLKGRSDERRSVALPPDIQFSPALYQNDRYVKGNPSIMGRWRRGRKTTGGNLKDFHSFLISINDKFSEKNYFRNQRN